MEQPYTDISVLNARIAELEANERAYEEIIGKMTYREVADELAATPQISPVSEMPNFFENCDAWGAAEWFNRLADAIRHQDAAVVAGDKVAFEICKNVAASSAMRLVRDYEQQVRSALAQTPAVGPGVIERMVTDAWDDARSQAIEECAKVAESEIRQREWPQLPDAEYRAPTASMQIAIAAAIRALADTSTNRENTK